MIQKTDLFFHEAILLLALRDDKGTIASGTMYQYAIGGAIVAELLINGRISVDDSKKKMVDVVSSTSVGDPVIDDCLERMRTSKRRAPVKMWVSRFARMNNLKNRIAEQLCRRGILRADEEKVLLIFSRRIYPEVDPMPERALIERLRQAIFTDSHEVDPRTVVLVSLANAANLLKVVFDKKELKGRKERIKQIMSGDVTGKATKEAIEAAQAAVMIAVILPAVFVATSSTH